MTPEPPIPDYLIAELLASLERPAARARRELAAAMSGGLTSRGWAAAEAVLDGIAALIADGLGGGLLAAALAGAWRVGDAVPGDAPTPTGTPPPAAPPPALAARLREQLDALPPDLRPLMLESLTPAVALALEPPAERPVASDADMAALSAVRPTPSQLPLVEEAVAHLRSRRLVRHEDLKAMAAEARLDALAVAGLARKESLGKLQTILAKEIEKGPTLAGFRKAVEGEIGGDAFLPARHLETTFRQAVHASYAAGQERMLADPAIGDIFPFVETLGIADSRQTALCAACSRSGIGGTAIYRRDDPTWQRIKNPRHWGCRCTSNYITARMASRAGVESPGAFVPMPGIALKAGL